MQANTQWGDGSKILLTVKPLVEGQTLQLMIGYVRKDRNLATFHNRNKNITDEMITLGIEEHSSLKMSYTDGKIILSRQNLYQKVWTYWMNTRAPATMRFSQVMTEILNDGNYVLSAQLLMISSGQMRRTSAEIYWSMLMGKKITEFEVENMLYLPKTPWESTYVPNQLPVPRPNLFGDAYDRDDDMEDDPETPSTSVGVRDA